MLIDEEKNCTFKPKLGRTAHKEKPLTVSHQTRCMSKLHFEQKKEEEFRQCTFNPAINPNYRHVESRYLSTPSTSGIAGYDEESRVEKDCSESDLAESVKGIERHLELRRKALMNEKEREKRMHSAFGIYSHDHPPNEKCIFCSKVVQVASYSAVEKQRIVGRPQDYGGSTFQLVEEQERTRVFAEG